MDRPWLGIDTATDVAGIALVDEAGTLVETVWRTRRMHTRLLAPEVARALAITDTAPDGLAGIGVTIGPGSYTGLRVGLAFAKGLAAAVSLPVVAVPTLDTVAAAVSPPRMPRAVPLWAVAQAGRGRVVAGRYPVDEAAWPACVPLRPLPLAHWLDAMSPGEWIAGELGPEERRLAADRGLAVLDVRRQPAFVAVLARRRGAEAARTPAARAALEPVYPVSGTVTARD